MDITGFLDLLEKLYISEENVAFKIGENGEIATDDGKEECPICFVVNTASSSLPRYRNFQVRKAAEEIHLGINDTTAIMLAVDSLSADKESRKLRGEILDILGLEEF